MFPVLNIGPLAIQVPGLLLLVGLWAGLTVSEKFSMQRGIKNKDVYNLVFLSLIAGILGSRIGYILQNFNIFLENPSSMISLNPGLLDPSIGIFAAIISALLYMKKHNLDYWNMLDALTPLFNVLVLALALAFLASGSYFGMPSEMPGSIQLWERARHPTQVYLFLAGLIILLLLWPQRRFVVNLQPGVYFMSFLCMFLFSFVIIEGLRANIATFLNGFRTLQVISLVLLIICLSVLSYRLKNPENQSLPNDS